MEIIDMSEKDANGRASKFDTLLGWALVRAMTLKAGSDPLNVFGIIPGKVTLMVSLTINGVEVPLEATLNIWKEERDRLVRREALSLIKDRFFTITQKVRDVERRIATMIREEFPDLYRDGDGENDALDLDLPVEYE